MSRFSETFLCRDERRRRRSCSDTKSCICTSTRTPCALLARSYVYIAPRNLHLSPSPLSSFSSASTTFSSSNLARVATLTGGRWNSRDVCTVIRRRARAVHLANERAPTCDGQLESFPRKDGQPRKSILTIARNGSTSRYTANFLENGTRERTCGCTRPTATIMMMTTVTTIFRLASIK